jgi:hypothetical protein
MVKNMIKPECYDEFLSNYLDERKVFHDNSLSYTSLHYAFEIGDEDVALYLIQQGSDPFAIDNEGNTPLFYAETKQIDTAPFIKAKQKFDKKKLESSNPTVTTSKTINLDLQDVMRNISHDKLDQLWDLANVNGSIRKKDVIAIIATDTCQVEKPAHKKLKAESQIEQ